MAKNDTKVEKNAPDLDKTSLALYYNDTSKSYEMITIKFNKLTKDAAVTDVKDMGSSRAVAVNDFKVGCFKLGMV